MGHSFQTAAHAVKAENRGKASSAGKVFHPGNPRHIAHSVLSSNQAKGSGEEKGPLERRGFRFFGFNMPEFRPRREMRDLLRNARKKPDKRA